MKKLVLCFFAFFLGFSAFAQTEKPEEKVTITEETVYEEVNAESEAKKFADMMGETTEITADQKDKIYKVVLKAMKEKKAIANLREKNEEKYKEKENEIFKLMNDEVDAIISKG